MTLTKQLLAGHMPHDELKPVPSKLLLRVAVAICKSRSCEGYACCQWPSNAARRAKDCPVKAGGYNDAAADALAVVIEES